MPLLKSLVYLAFLAMLQAGGTAYKSEIEKWRRNREAQLTADEGWLTVAGLFWLKEGKNTVGSDPSNDIVLPAGGAPARLGVFDFHSGVTTFVPEPGALDTDGKPARPEVLKPDTSGAPDILRVGALSMFVIHRGDRDGIRLRDENSQMRRHFTGLKYYPAKEEYRVTARFVPYDPPKMIAVPNILGQTENQPSPGYLEFTLRGKRLRLDPLVEDKHLFVIFKDFTSGGETYPPGRFLNAAMPANGKAANVILDFNKAYNPPCAFTPFATCPLPPKQNQLSVRIEAGELRYGH
jgi:uncharacterized protein